MEDRLAVRFYENNIISQMKTAEDNIALLQKLGIAIQLSTISTDGWVADENIWIYSSADSPTFVISVNADMTEILSPGMRIKLTQTTVKYFIVTAVGAYSGGATLVTVYGGTDYTLANASISSPYYSPVKAPLAFPLDPDKWSVTLTDTTERSQASPTLNQWYNLGSLSISIPIGEWKGIMEGLPYSKGSSILVSAQLSLSTSNNSESDFNNTTFVAAISQIYGHVTKNINLTVISKTTYYPIIRTTTISTTLGLSSSLSPLIIKLTSAYL